MDRGRRRGRIVTTATTPSHSRPHPMPNKTPDSAGRMPLNRTGTWTPSMGSSRRTVRGETADQLMDTIAGCPGARLTTDCGFRAGGEEMGGVQHPAARRHWRTAFG
ncbi:unnamed protein product [Bursaphelenchus xylophilus]|uniref:(pine wood nematode) hypothetical protein n=1 Tax=Bursaphelenchus xylophilus TaxID=6326 RepID=A0A1I7RYE2_BURXY|nr:unnamed protein product [Bursaphelenchus xylophilus]CAG9085657.1 unnamed protein product [Bursaphelenchus xylophilus]